MKVYNILRQLKEIQIQADYILNEDAFSIEKLKIFFKFSEDINSAIIATIANDLVLSLIKEIQDAEFTEILKSSKVVELFGFDFFGLFKNHPKLFFVKDLIFFLKSKYASIELLLKNGSVLG